MLISQDKEGIDSVKMLLWTEYYLCPPKVLMLNLNLDDGGTSGGD